MWGVEPDKVKEEAYHAEPDQRHTCRTRAPKPGKGKLTVKAG